MHSYSDTEEKLKEDVVHAFQKGAEFGYNKALNTITKCNRQALIRLFSGYLITGNVWHKVADGDLPNNARTVIIAYYAVDEKTVGTKEVKRTNEIVTEQCWYLDNQGWTDTSDGEPYPYLNMEGVVIAWCELPKYKE